MRWGEEERQLWATLPHALGLLWGSREWSELAHPKLSEGALTANMHCLVYGVHALLTAVEPLLPTPAAAPSGAPIPPDAPRAHLAFLEISASYLTSLRRAMHEGRPSPSELKARERSHAAIVDGLRQRLFDLVVFGYAVGPPGADGLHRLALASAPTSSLQRRRRRGRACIMSIIR